ncbi:MAG TPA: hypothetical protein VN969_05310 [Streptosporangiaceae bacterium]|nr:hypothetical protein [Streptosporangiaceae bacterium]
MRGASAMMAAYTGQVAYVMAARAPARARQARARDAQARWAGHGAAAILPDAIIVPVVTTRLAAEHMETIIHIGAELRRLAAEHDTGTQAAAAAGHDGSQQAAGQQARAERDAREARMMDLRRQLAGEAIALVTGPDAVAAWLRQGLLGAPGTGPLSLALAGKSLPLDVGHSKTIPPQIRLATTIRSPHCQAPGCWQPAWDCETHHLTHREETSRERVDPWWSWPVSTSWWRFPPGMRRSPRAQVPGSHRDRSGRQGRPAG